MRKKEVSFRRKLMSNVLWLTIPLIVLLFVSNLYSIQVFNGKIADSNLRTLDYRAETIEHSLSATDDLLVGVMAASEDFRTLQSGAGQLQAHLASYSLFNQLKTALPSYEDLGAIFIYSTASKTERDMFSSDIEYDDKLQIREFVRSAVRNDTYTYSMQWRLANINDSAYLFRFYGGRGTYLAAMVPLERLSDTSRLLLDGEAVVLFADRENEPVTAKDFTEESGIDLNGDYSRFFISGKGGASYMIVGRELAQTDCRLILAVRQSGFFGALNGVQLLLFVVSVLALVLIPVLQYQLTRSIAQPVEELRQTMEQIRSGEADAKASNDTNIKEFAQVNDTFNTMMEQITNLKIEAYEHELETQMAKLKYLQLQIRPHFFLNCLKSLYALAQARNYDRIQKTILAFSKHIRYTFADNEDSVPLSRELDHIKNYLEIQGGSSQYTPVCRMDIDPRLLDLPIPPLSLQTFVENSIKWAFSPDHALEIDIKASILNSGDDTFADLTVSDNGGGFSEQTLREINDPNTSFYGQHHIGLNNVKKRMELMYGNDALYAFYNKEVGTVSEIFVPIDREKYESKEERR